MESKKILLIAFLHNSSPTSGLIFVWVNWVSIGSDNGLSPIRHQVIIQSNAGLMSIGPHQHISMKFQSQYKIFKWRKCIWKYCIWNRYRWVRLTMIFHWTYEQVGKGTAIKTKLKLHLPVEPEVKHEKEAKMSCQNIISITYTMTICREHRNIIHYTSRSLERPPPCE